MTLPCVFHDVFIAVADTLAEAIEGEVGSVLWILRMFETNLRRVFLKFERFSSLRKRCRAAPYFARRCDRRVSARAKLSLCRSLISWRERAGGALLPPSFGNRPFTIPIDSARPDVRI